MLLGQSDQESSKEAVAYVYEHIGRLPVVVEDEI